jgi:CspA family cold shock protein
VAEQAAGPPRAAAAVHELEEGGEMATGTVRWFNDSKGYGFIQPDGGGRDLFVHHSEIIGTGFRTLPDGAKVSFEARQGQKGPEATSVSVLES